MLKPFIQPYYHPTTVVMVDDNQRFLENFSLQLDETLACMFFSSAKECLTMLNGRAKRTPLDQRCFSYYQQPTNSDRVIRLDLTLIEQEISNPERFRDVSVVVVDYDMPEMTGLEFCQRVRNHRVKKILLTGVADEKVAVEAFNAGIIDHFMMKSDPQITTRINRTIADLQRRYFSEISSLIQSTLALEAPDFLYDSEFIRYFFELVDARNIAEYYYVEDPSGFLMVSETGQLRRLVVYSEADLQRTLFNLRLMNPPATIMKQISSGKAVPWLWAAPDEFDEDEDFYWSDYVHAAHRVVGEDTWFCALVDSPPADIEYDSETSSYMAYLTELDKQP
ncbi:response regulator [Alcanivorax quisquiliarum]|uniref:Response regulator n=1 Tax=Alcanivorax quisquiliarum TaxID=2933565 RepID=A0ABT0E700_9GAMM|nr:response regulator [Alcanivorax quisquiliarum]MCK0537434.1 response regulator [Alcanivorax quisquiliarum]